MLHEIWRHRDFVLVDGNTDLFKKSLFPKLFFPEVIKISLLYGKHIIVFVTESLRFYKEYFVRFYKA